MCISHINFEYTEYKYMILKRFICKLTKFTWPIILGHSSKKLPIFQPHNSVTDYHDTRNFNPDSKSLTLKCKILPLVNNFYYSIQSNILLYIN